MKKRFAKLLAITSLMFVTVGCSETSSATSDSTAGDSTAVSDVAITAASESYTIERNSSVTVRVTVTGSVSNKTVNFTLEQDTYEYAAFDDDAVTTGVTSIKVNGLATGSATLVATSVADPSVSIRIPLTIVRAVPSLQKVWSNVISNTSYTLNITRTPTTDELSESDSWTDDTQIPVSRYSYTATSLIYEEAKDVQEDLSCTYGAGEDYIGDSYSVWGYGIDTNGYAFYLTTDNTTSEYLTAGEIVKVSGYGLLDSSNFKGMGEDASSPFGVGYFYGLEAINPEWLSSEKISGNSYLLNDEDDESTYPDYAEMLLWEMVDYDGYGTAYTNAINSGVSTDAELCAAIAENVEVTIDALDSSTVSIEVATEETTYTITMSDVGSTTNSAALTTFLSTATASLPDLPDELQALKDATADHNYVVHANSYFGEITYYLTENYYYIYYTEAYVTTYNAYIDQYYPGQYSHLSVGGEGYLKRSDGIYYFEYTPANTTTGASESVTVASSAITNSSGSTNLWNVDYSSGGVVGYIETDDLFTGNYLYSLSDSEYSIFSSYSAIYYTYSASTAEAILGWYAPSSTLETSDSYISGIHVDSTTSTDGEVTVTSASFLLAYQGDTVGSYYLYYTPSIDSFGTADTTNPQNALITAKISA